MERRIIFGICFVVAIVVCILVFIENNISIENHTNKSEIDYSNYPASLSNNYIWSHGSNVNYYGSGQGYTIKQDGQWYNFCGIQYNNFRWVENTSLYWSEGTSYYYKGMSYRFPPTIYRLEFNYNTNGVAIIDI